MFFSSFLLIRLPKKKATEKRFEMGFITKDDTGLFACPCGFKSHIKFTVERHLKTCKTVKAASMEVDEAALLDLKQSLAAKELLLSAANARVDALESEVGRLTKENRELKKRKSGSVTNITNNITVNLPPFHVFSSSLGKGTISTDYSLPDKSLVKSLLLRDPASAVPKYIEAKYFATQTPSIVLPNVKKPELRVVEKGRDGESRWVTVDKDETIESMIDRGFEELEETYNAKRMKPYASWIEREQLEEDGFDRKPAYKRVKKDVEMVIINSRK